MVGWPPKTRKGETGVVKEIKKREEEQENINEGTVTKGHKQWNIQEIERKQRRGKARRLSRRASGLLPFTGGEEKGNRKRKMGRR